MSREMQAARNVYLWLWVSPLFTIPTLFAVYMQTLGYRWVCGEAIGHCNLVLVTLLDGLIALFVSMLWHLVLLIPAFNQRSRFVRWHGWQALLLAAVRTAIPLSLWVLSSLIGDDYAFFMLSAPLLLGVWFFGNLWGQGQAVRGDCALMRWAGQAEGLPARA